MFGGVKLSKKDEQLIFQGSITALFIFGIYVYFKTGSLNKALLAVFGLLILVLLILTVIRLIQIKKLKRSGINKIDQMDGFLFEEYLSLLFKEHGYKTKRTKNTGDFGADLIISKNNEKIVVQAKRYNNNVGIKAIQEVIGSVKYYNADRAMVITNSYFTKPAIKLAETNNVELVNRDKLINMLLIMNPDESKISLDNIKPLCPSCDLQMVIRKSRFGKKFYGCSNFPSCRETINME